MGLTSVLPYVKHLWSKGTEPVYLIFEPTLRCNASCRTCYNLDNLNQAMDEITLAEVDRFTKSMNTRLLVLALSGGEVFLREDLPEIVDIFYRNTRMQHLSIPTNALLPRRIRDLCRKILSAFPGWFVVHLSLDGIGRLHDDIRRVPGNFDKALETYELLVPLTERYANFQISANTTLNRMNINATRDIFEFVRRRLPKVRNHTFSIIRNPPSSDMNFDVPRFLTENRDLLRRIVWAQKPYGFDPLAILNLAYNELYYEFSYEFRSTGKRSYDCFGGSLACYIDAKANVYPCEMLKPIGNLRESGWDFARIYRGERACRSRKEVQEKKCACDHGCFLQVSTLLSPRTYPRLAKIALRHAFQS